MGKQKMNSKKSRADKLVAIAVIALVAVIVLTLAVSVMSEMGVFLRMQSAVEVGDVQINGAMMSFFMNDYIMNWYTENSAYAAYFSIDLTQDLRNQKFGQTGYYETSFLGSFEGTWYDYFMTKVKSEVETFVIYANAADKQGIGLTDEDHAEIDEVMKGIDTTLKAYGVSYSEWFGTGVTKRDVRRCYELKYKAANFAEFFQNKLEDEIKDDEIVEYREENKELYYTADCLTYTISKTSKGMTADEFKAAKSAAKAAADAIAKATSPEEFVQFVESYESSVKAEEDAKTEAKTETKTEATTESKSAATTESTETETTDPFEEYKEVIKYETETGSNADNELNDFLFGNEETGSDKVEAATKNDAIVIEESGTVTEKVTTAATTTPKENIKTEATTGTDATEAESVTGSDATETGTEAKTETETKKETTTTSNIKTYDKYEVTVYFVFEPSHIDKELTHSFSYLVVDNKDVLATFIEKYKANETKDLDAFVDVANKYYEDIHAAEDHEHKDDEMFAFDKLEKQAAGYFNTNYSKLNDWVEDAARKEKDLSDIIEITIKSTDSTTKKETTTTQYGVLFFEKHEGETWYESAKTGKINEKVEAWYEDQLIENPVNFSKVVNEIDTAKPFLALMGY